MNFTKKTVLVLVLISALVFSSFAILAQDGSDQKGNSEQQPTIVATVNGEKITQQELSQSTQVYQIIMTLSQQYRTFAQFLMTSESGSKFLTEYRKYVLDQLITQNLRAQQIEKMGITVPDDEVQTEIDNIIENNKQFKDEKALEDYLKNNQNMTMDNLESMIRDNLKVQKLKEEVSKDVSVSEEEIQEFYNNNKESYKDDEGNVKPLEEVREQITNSLMNQKQNESYNNWLEKVKESAEIEKKEENI